MIFFGSIAQPSIEWQRCYGSTENEDARCIKATSDGGFIKTGIINADQIEIGISDLASGPYLFRIIGQASEIVKFIKE